MTTLAGRIEKPAPPPKPWTRQRFIGWGLIGLWVLIIGGLVLWMIEAWNPELFNRYYPRYISGLIITLELVAASIVLGALLSFPLAMMRMSRNKVLNGIAYAYVYFFRGTPLLAQTFLIYYGLGEFRPQLESIACGAFSRMRGIAAFSPSRSTRQPIRQKFCAEPLSVSAGASGKAQHRSAFPNG